MMANRSDWVLTGTVAVLTLVGLGSIGGAVFTVAGMLRW